MCATISNSRESTHLNMLPRKWYAVIKSFLKLSVNGQSKKKIEIGIDLNMVETCVWRLKYLV